MESYEDALREIKKILLNNPKGLTISEISEKIGINRNSVAKYMDVLSISGNIEKKDVGPAKVFFLSQRLPLSSFIEITTEGIIILNKDLEIIMVNDFFSKLIKTKKDNLYGQKINQEQLKNFFGSIEKDIQNCINGKDCNKEIIADLDNEKRYFNIKIIPITLDNGNPGVSLVIDDVTEHRNADEALRISEEKYREIVETASEGISMADAAGKFIFVNPRWAEMLGYPQEEILGKDVLYFLDEEQKELVLKTRNKVIKEGKTTGREFKFIRKDGSILWTISNITPFFDKNKNYTSNLVMHTDISERKKAEEELKESEMNFRNLAEKSPNMVFINKKGRIVYVNEKCEEIMGYTKSEFYSEKFDFMCLTSPEYRNILIENFKKHLSNKDVEPVEYSLITKDKKIIIAILTTKLIDYGGEKAILGIITDITERKKAEEKIIHLASFPDSNPNPVIEIDSKGKITYCNKSTTDISKELGEEEQVFLPEDISEILNSFKEDIPKKFYREIKIKDRVFAEYISFIMPLKVLRIYAADITEKKKAEEELKSED
ncbi:Methyl sulfide methyltransferase-associated sensor [uncultured archaeon]|nr:Methyl sulfide methyltransferase-associated sensor [uncultured archaeon]